MFGTVLVHYIGTCLFLINLHYIHPCAHVWIFCSTIYRLYCSYITYVRVDWCTFVLQRDFMPLHTGLKKRREITGTVTFTLPLYYEVRVHSASNCVRTYVQYRHGICYRVQQQQQKGNVATTLTENERTYAQVQIVLYYTGTRLPYMRTLNRSTGKEGY